MENVLVTINNNKIFSGVGGKYRKEDWSSDLDSMMYALMYRMFTWPDNSFKSIHNKYTKTIFFWNFLKKSKIFPNYKTAIQRYKKRYH